MVKVSIIILNWNQPKLTVECLESLLKLKVSNFKLNIVIVDNGSTDNSVEIIEKLKIKEQNARLEIKLLKNKDNLGFAEGNNVGIKYAIKDGADYILILNNDTTVDRDLIINLLRRAETNTNVGIIAPKIYFAKGYEFHKRYKDAELGKVIWAVGGQIDWNNIYGTNRSVDEVDHGQFEESEEIDFASGAALFIKTEVLKSFGLFDEKYFMYLEDLELSQRVNRSEWKVLYEPKAIVWHKVAQSSKIGGNLNDYFITRNRLLFGMRYAKLRTKLALFRESIRLMLSGRKWQKIGVRDYYLGRLEKGSWAS